MKITYLGTAAAEGFPAIFCNCDYCRMARKLGGKNIRTRSQAIINDDLLIDFPADTYYHFLNNNIEGDKIKSLLITHSHQDHLYTDDFKMRCGAFSHNMRNEELCIYCGNGAYKKITETDITRNQIKLCMMSCFEPQNIGEYTVTALPARHFDGDGALFYIIQQENKTILYAHDTGYFYDEVFEYINNSKIKFDLISLDCTNVDIPITDSGTHMGLDNIHRVVNKLMEMGSINQSTKILINHFSHNANPLHQVLEQRVDEYGYIVSYDGLSIEV